MQEVQLATNSGRPRRPTCALSRVSAKKKKKYGDADSIPRKRGEEKLGKVVTEKRARSKNDGGSDWQSNSTQDPLGAGANVHR